MQIFFTNVTCTFRKYFSSGNNTGYYRKEMIEICGESAMFCCEMLWDTENIALRGWHANLLFVYFCNTCPQHFIQHHSRDQCEKRCLPLISIWHSINWLTRAIEHEIEICKGRKWNKIYKWNFNFRINLQCIVLLALVVKYLR